MFMYFWVFQGLSTILENFGTLILIRKWQDFACSSAHRDYADFLLTPHTLSSYCRCNIWYCTLAHHTAQPSSCTANVTLQVLHTFSTRTADVTFPILQTFCSHHALSSPIADVALLMLHILSSHCTTFWLYCRCNPPGTAHFSPCTADVTFLILQTFSACTVHPLFLLGSDTLHTVHLLLILNTLS